MAFSAPQLVSGFAAVEQIIALPSSTEPFVIVVKNHIGSPRRELETFSVTEVIAATPDPTRVEVLDQVFTDVSGVLLSGDSVRLYWNDRVPDPQSPIIRQVDYNLTTNIAGAVTVLPFPGLDPFVLDARTGANPNNLLLLYVTAAGANVYRLSTDLGASWGNETTITEATENVTNVEASFTDLLGARQTVQVLQRRL